MKDRLRYVIDSRYYNGTCLTCMTDGVRSDHGGETLEELRTQENNPYLTVVTSKRIDKMNRLYLQSLCAPFKEITEVILCRRLQLQQCIYFLFHQRKPLL